MKEIKFAKTLCTCEFDLTDVIKDVIERNRDNQEHIEKEAVVCYACKLKWRIQLMNFDDYSEVVLVDVYTK